MNHDDGQWDEEATERFWKTLGAISSTEMVRNTLEEWKTEFGPAFGAASEFLGEVRGGRNRCRLKECRDFPDSVSVEFYLGRWKGLKHALPPLISFDGPSDDIVNPGVSFQLLRFLRRIKLMLGYEYRASNISEWAPCLFWLGFMKSQSIDD